MTGEITFVSGRDYRFAKPDGPNEEHFFHVTQLDKHCLTFEQLRIGQRCDFKSVRGERGPEAANLKVTED
jgi:cold shock CspA family protein